LGAAIVSAVTTDGRLQRVEVFLRDVRSPRWGLAGQGFRFALSGSLVAILYVSITTLLHEAFAVPFQIALAAGFLVGVTVHFTLQRVFVWRHYEQFALAWHQQATRYLLVCGSQYGITALSSAQLPALLGLPVELVYLLTVLSVTGLNFILFRGRVFHAVAVVGSETT